MSIIRFLVDKDGKLCKVKTTPGECGEFEDAVHNGQIAIGLEVMPNEGSRPYTAMIDFFNIEVTSQFNSEEIWKELAEEILKKILKP
jgi:hypothetical protein